MQIEVVPDGDALARRGAAHIAEHARAALEARQTFTLALSGGRTPQAMLSALTAVALPWERVHVFQVDERVAPPHHPDRNLTALAANLVDQVPIPAPNVHSMAVDQPDLEGAAEHYAAELQAVCGPAAVLDLVHLGLGDDGHTASLVPGDPVLSTTDRDVAMTGPYNGHRRMTLTYPILDRARAILWLVAGTDKVDALARLAAGDPHIPAGRVNQLRAHVLAEPTALDG